MADVLMADVSPTVASVISNLGALASWSRLQHDDDLSRLRSKFWGKKIEDESREWRESHPAVEDDVDNDIGEGCYALDPGIDLKCAPLWVRKDYKRIYDYCVEKHAEGPTFAKETARSVVITGQPGVGVFLGSFSLPPITNHLRKKANRIGSLMPSVVVSENKNRSYGIKMATVSYLSKMECLNKTSIPSNVVTLLRSYGPSSMRTMQPVFP